MASDSLKRSSIFEVGVKAGQWVDQSCHQDSKQKDELVISGWDSKPFLMAIGHYRIVTIVLYELYDSL
jgi:hypothetical protein